MRRRAITIAAAAACVATTADWLPHRLSLSKSLPFNNRSEHFPVVVGRVEEVDILDRSQVRRPSGLLYALGGLETGRGRLRTAQVY